MRAYLISLTGRKAGLRVPLMSEVFVIGRDAICHLRPRSKNICGRHCAVVSRNGVLVVKDLGSAIGTYVNGRRVHGECPMMNGDKLRIGPVVFAVHLVTDADAEMQTDDVKAQEAHARDDTVIPLTRPAVPVDADVLLADMPARPEPVRADTMPEIKPAHSVANSEGDPCLRFAPLVAYVTADGQGFDQRSA